MRRTLSGLSFALLALTVFAASFPATARAETVGCGSEITTHLFELKKSIVADAKAGLVDQALLQLKEFDDYKDAPQAADARLAVAKAAREDGRAQESADLLKITVKEDPYNLVTPDSLALLCTILYEDLKDEKQYQQYLSQLATNYYPGIPVVAQARSAYEGKFVDAPKAKKILLDETLGGGSIVDRGCYPGFCNNSQWEVICTLGEAGYVVHDNHYHRGSILTADVMSQYGLVIINGGRTVGRMPLPEAAIESIVNYVNAGGRLLIVGASKTYGGTGMEPGQMAEYLNPLVSRFGLEFDADYTTGAARVKCKPADHPAMKGVDEFLCEFGTRVSGGTPLGFYESIPVMAVTNYGKGVVMAAGIGRAFRGSTIGNLCATDKQKAEAQVNRAFLVKLAQYLTSSVK